MHTSPDSTFHRGTGEIACRMCGTSDLRFAGTVWHYPYVECRNCAFAFTPAVSRKQLEARYSSGFRDSDGAPEQGWADTEFLSPAFARLARNRSLSIFDFGTGQSIVPDVLRSQGHKVFAIDLMPPIRSHPDRLTGSLMDFDLPPGSFDLVYSFQVFEHLPEPRPTLRRLLGLVRPDTGFLMIHTDMETPERRNGLTEWWYVTPPDHCCFFRHKTFDRYFAATPHNVCWRDPKTIIVSSHS